MSPGREEQIAAGGVWAIPGVGSYWIRPLDGARVHVRTGAASRPYTHPSRPRSPIHSLGGTTRTVASLVRAALADPDAQPVTYLLPAAPAAESEPS